MIVTQTATLVTAFVQDGRVISRLYKTGIPIEAVRKEMLAFVADEYRSAYDNTLAIEPKLVFVEQIPFLEA